MRCDVGMEEGEYRENRLCLAVYNYNGPQRYEQFLQVGRLYRALILLGLALSSKRLCVFSLHGAQVLYSIIKFVLLTSFSLHFNEVSLVGLVLDLID